MQKSEKSEEYKALTDHYFHEGNLMLKRNQFFIALNFGLFTIMGILFRVDGRLFVAIPNLMLVICFLGASMSAMWVIMTGRARMYIEARVTRIKQIERELGYKILSAL